MPTRKVWTPEYFIEKLTGVHRRWQRDTKRGKLADRHFNRTYCHRYGLRRPFNVFSANGELAALIARCPPDVQMDWRNDRAPEWISERIIARIAEIFEHWKQHGMSKGMSWNQTYLERNGAGGMLRSLGRDGLRAETFVRRIGGEVAAHWTVGWRYWDSDRMRTMLRAAHRTWRSDAEYGRPSGKRFCSYYLMRRRYFGLLRATASHCRGGIHGFVRTVPEVARDWFYQPRYTMSDLRRLLRTLLAAWRHDSAAQNLCVRFGPAYLIATGQRRIFHALERKGRRRVFGHRSMATVVRFWGKRVPGSHVREIRNQRATYFTQVRFRTQ